MQALGRSLYNRLHDLHHRTRARRFCRQADPVKSARGDGPARGRGVAGQPRRREGRLPGGRQLGGTAGLSLVTAGRAGPDQADFTTALSRQVGCPLGAQQSRVCGAELAHARPLHSCGVAFDAVLEQSWLLKLLQNPPFKGMSVNRWVKQGRLSAHVLYPPQVGCRVCRLQTEAQHQVAQSSLWCCGGS